MKFKFSLMKKMVLGITVVSTITYGTSAFFLEVVRNWTEDYISGGTFMFITFALGIFWTGFLGMLAARRIVKPLLQLMERADQISAGNLAVRVEAPRSDDELRALTLSFGKMLDQLKKIVQSIRENYDKTDTHVDELKSAIEQATFHIEQITLRIEEISNGAEQQSRSAETMVHSMEKMNQATADINDQAQSARESTRHMNATISESESVVRSLVDGMKKLVELNRQSLEAVRRLDEHTVHIGEISDVVGEIADRTRILALNASIEAVRAGAEGKGFAVVAENVRNLAAQSAKSVDDIRELITRIQSEIQDVVTTVTEQTEVAEKEAVHGESSLEALRKVTGEADNVSGMVERISEMANAQAELMDIALSEARDVAEIAERISAGTQDVYASIQEQTAIMEEIGATADELKGYSVSLNEKISFFKAEGPEESSPSAHDDEISRPAAVQEGMAT